ncbi:HEPN domain-containing protein [Aureisphaera galaxeae]|uniref:HEPN domain-containing protein n=1 Tax=Aureisphaera galaxeae TaxID=1538023 RepID=UPI00235077EE|nr:HEPN domain-containing protein [Aureisphaera galaxeae]MDC8005542.1 HEPN domain-containing protein [Aureisphaera galaxeae]
MIAKSYIRNTLEELNKLYNNSQSQKKAIYFSKLALIELCGWIEETVDDIVIKHANRKLNDSSNKDYCRKNIVKPNYGFQYNRNIRPMLISTIGLIEVEKLERELERTGKITLLKGYLANIKDSRNSAAHTHLKGTTRTYNAPSRTIGDFNKIGPILEKIDQKLRSF